MPVLTLLCPDCGHVFHGGVFPATKPPTIWICSHCHGDRAAEIAAPNAPPHPWSAEHSGCGCCG